MILRCLICKVVKACSEKWLVSVVIKLNKETLLSNLGRKSSLGKCYDCSLASRNRVISVISCQYRYSVFYNVTFYFFHILNLRPQNKGSHCFCSQ